MIRGLVFWAVLLMVSVAVAETPSVRQVQVLRQRVGRHLDKLEERRGPQKNLRSEYRNIVGNGRKQWKSLQRLDERIIRAMPVDVEQRCLDNPLC